MYLVPNIHPGSGSAGVPTVQANFAGSPADWTTLDTVSSMPSGGSISRSGNAMLYDSTGKLTYAPNNLLTYSEQFDNANWTKANGGTGVAAVVTANAAVAPDGTTTADQIVFDRGAGTSGSDISYITQSITSVTAAGISSVWLKTTDNSTKTLTLRCGASTFQQITVTGTWTRFNAVASSSSIDRWSLLLYGNVGASQTVSVYAWGAQLELTTYQTTPSTYVATTSAAYYGPRFDYDPSTLAAKGLLIEGTRTNLVLQSSALTNAAWTAYQAAFTTDATLDPTGVAAQKLTATSGTTRQPQVYSTATVAITSGSQYTLSCYVKAGTLNYAAITLYGNVTGHWVSAVFDLSTSATTTASQTAVGGTSGTLYSTFKQNVGNGWYRVGITCSVAQSAAMTIIELAPAATGNTFAVASGSINFGTAAGTENIYISAPQLELGAFATSYIPTVASSVTRAAETFAITGYSSNLINATYIDEQTGVTSMQPYNAGVAPSPSFAWLTALRVYTNAYAGNISTPSWLSFSRTGNAMVTDSTGKLVWAAANMCPYSADIGSANWGSLNAGTGVAPTVTSNYATAPDGTNTATRLQVNRGAGTTSSDYSFRRMPTTGVTGVVGRSYLLSFYLKATSGTQEVTFWLGGGTTPIYQTVTVTDTAWTRVSVIDAPVSAATLIPSIGKVGNQGTTATADVLVWGCQIENVTYDTQPSAYIPTTTAAVYGPRYDFDASTVPATPRGLLIEESRSNICLRSQEFDNASWLKTSVTVSANSVIAPDGTQTADTLTPNAGAGTTWDNYQAITIANATAYTFSCYVKTNGAPFAAIAATAMGGVIYAGVNLATGATTSSGTVTVSAVNVGNGWYRLIATATSSSTSTGFYVFPSSNGTTKITADGVSGVYLWGAQLEAGSFATSYIPTTSASVTRAADVAQLTGSALTVAGAATGTAIVQTGTSSDPIAVQPYILATSGNRRLLYISSGNLVGTYDGTNVTTTNVGDTKLQLRSAVSWSASPASLVVNNGTVATGAVVLGTGASVYLGTDGSTRQINRCVQSLALYNQRLPDAILKQKSSPNAPY